MSGKAGKGTHLSRTNKRIILREVAVTDESKAGAYKPAGFWYEVDADWRRWCESEDFGSYEHVYSVELNDCNVLIVDTLKKLDAFHGKYSVRSRLGVSQYFNVQIDWERVAKEFDGVEIAPYRWKRRLVEDFSWYYGWDCASGVIWRPRNASVTYTGVYEPAKEQSREIANA